MEYAHQSVLLAETVDGLKIKPDGIYVDGTLGGGGHAAAIAERLKGQGMLIGIDQDEAAITAAGKRLAGSGKNTVTVRGNFRDTRTILKELAIGRIDGMVLDLGVSSHQLDSRERGFSYKYDTRLDMRMDTGQELSAREIVNQYSEKELFRVIKEYGEEKFAGNIVRHIVKARAIAAVETTGQLNEIIRNAIPARLRAEGGHPSKRTFQAIRIECNRELEILRETLGDLIELLNPAGRIAVITFHSLEDRIVKTIFRTAENPCICPPDLPVCGCGRVSKGKVITGKPILPGEAELAVNKRAQSAKLRIFQKI